MSAHVLLNLLNEAYQAFYLFFSTNLIISILDSTYHMNMMTLKICKNGILGVKTSIFGIFYVTL